MNEVYEYKISCPIIGFLQETPNKTIFEAFDSADFGVLHNVDLISAKEREVKGYYSFTVKAHSEKEALSKAQEVFNGLWDNGAVDCGDLYNIDRDIFDDGDDYHCRGIIKGK